MKPGTVKSAKAAIALRGVSRPPRATLAMHIRALTAGYDFTERDLADILDVNKRTITRWKAQNERLSPQQIDRIRVVESIMDLGKRALGSKNEMKLWLNSPVFSLEGQKPIELIKTESGRRRVENVLLQIEGGAY